MKIILIRSVLLHLILLGVITKSIAVDPEEDGVRPNRDGIFNLANHHNKISNADFEKGTTLWMLGKYNGGRGRFISDTTRKVFNTAAAFVSTSNSIDQQFGDIQLFTMVKLKNQACYSVSFQAASAGACLVSVSFSGGRDTYFEEVILLSPGVNLYGPFEFSSPVDDDFVVFALNLGKTGNRIWIDDVALYEDESENRFNEIIAGPGINIYQYDDRNELFIQLHSAATEDLPVIITDERGRVLITSMISKGIQEATLGIPKNTTPGNYEIKVITPTRVLDSVLVIR